MGNNPITSRDIELLNSQSGTIATRGTVAKRSSDPVPVHGGQHHVGPNGEFNAGISSTAAAAALAGGKLPTDPPVIGKRLAPVELHPGMKSRTSPGLDTSAHKELGRLILASATRTK